jgi:hypothetical protein
VSTTTDVILAAGPTVVAVVAIGSGVWHQRRGLAHERTMGDLADVRELLDAAAVALHEADHVYGDWFLHAPASPTQEDERRLDAARKTIDRVIERLAVRLGPRHDVVANLRAANGAFLALERAVRDTKSWDDLTAAHDH